MSSDITMGTPQIIKPTDINKFLKQGYKIWEPHLHTSKSYDVVEVEELRPASLYHKMKQAGFSFITFTDHDTLDAYEDIFEKDMIRGVEIKIKPKEIDGLTHTYTLHINVYQLNKKQLDELEEIAEQGEFYTFITYLKKAKLPYVLNHPTWHEPGESIHFEVLNASFEYFDVIEVMNGAREAKNNEFTYQLAIQENKGMICGSDSHIGKPWPGTLVKGDTFEEAWKNIKKGEVLLVPCNNTAQDTAEVVFTVLHNTARAVADQYEIGMKSGLTITDALMKAVSHPRVNKYIPIMRAISKLLTSILNLGYKDYTLCRLAMRYGYISPQERALRRLQKESEIRV